MKIDLLGIPRFTEDDIVEMIQSGHVDKCVQVLCEDSAEIQRFNQSATRFGRPKLQIYNPISVSLEEFDSSAQSTWFMPEEYQEINILDLLTARCTNQDEVERVELELEEYKERNMYNVLRYMLFLVDTMREHNIVWGVGRGSSVASFVLYLIGVHRINSVQYGLDFTEFMR